MGIIFRTMFPDSATASHFSCGEQKASFIMCFGLAPHFKNILLRSLQEMSVYVLLFDKTYNHTTKDNRWTFLFVTGHSNCTTMYVTLVFIGQLVTLTICCSKSCRQLKTLISLRHCKCHWMVWMSTGHSTSSYRNRWNLSTISRYWTLVHVDSTWFMVCSTMVLLPASGKLVQRHRWDQFIRS